MSEPTNEEQIAVLRAFISEILKNVEQFDERTLSLQELGFAAFKLRVISDKAHLLAGILGIDDEEKVNE